MTAKFGKEILDVENEFSIIGYKGDSKNIGTATVILEGNGIYKGRKEVNFKIIGASISKAKVVNLQSFYEYTDAEIEPDKNENIQVYLPAVDKNGENIILIPEKGGNTPLPKVKYAYSDGKQAFEKVLDLGKDYTLKYKNNKSVTEGRELTAEALPAIIITGKENFKGVYTAETPITFEITKKLLETITNIVTTDVVYKAVPNICKTTMVITDSNGKKLVAGADYDKAITYTYAQDTWVTQKGSVEKIYRKPGSAVDVKDIIPADTEIIATVKALEKSNCYYTGSTSKLFRIGTENISKAKVTFKNTFIHSKEGVWLKYSDLEVKIGTEILTERDYKIESHSMNDRAGRATIVLKGRGNYCGTKMVTVNIGAKTFLKASLLF